MDWVWLGLALCTVPFATWLSSRWIEPWAERLVYRLLAGHDRDA